MIHASFENYPRKVFKPFMCFFLTNLAKMLIFFLIFAP